MHAFLFIYSFFGQGSALSKGHESHIQERVPHHTPHRCECSWLGRIQVISDVSRLSFPSSSHRPTLRVEFDLMRYLWPNRYCFFWRRFCTVASLQLHDLDRTGSRKVFLSFSSSVQLVYHYFAHLTTTCCQNTLSAFSVFVSPSVALSVSNTHIMLLLFNCT